MLNFTVAARSEDRQNYYQGKTIRVVIGTATSPGSGLELNTRIFSKYLSQYIPGNPTIIFSNMVGGGGITATNFVNDDTDGLMIGAPLSNILLIGMMKEDKNITFSSQTLKWLGSIDDFSTDVGLLILRNEVPYDANRIILGETSDTKIFDIPSIYNRIIDSRSKIIFGYKGKDEVVLAFRRDELNAFTIAHSNLLNKYNINDIYSMSRPVLQYGHNKRHPLYKDIPTFYEVAVTEEQKMMIDVLQMMTYINKPLHMGSKVDDWKVDIVRKAFLQVCKDSNLIAEMSKFHFPVNCLSGELVQTVVQDRHNSFNVTYPLTQKYFKR